ncbi:MAG: Crp/Fnr family transcriptional regulator [Nitrospirae bacterium]|nr:Crp/Fnr family transcriptional regulator [Nitrospirota bacterium]
MHIPKGEFIFLEGDECRQLALILAGTVRVYKPAESGREITLYRLGPGESCILTASCIFAHGSFPAVAVTEEDIEAGVIPSLIFREWISRHDIWRTYVFNLLSKRLSEVIATIEEVAFRRMDIRIAEMLVKLHSLYKEGIKTTHQDIAMELGTSREVVSRILKNFEYENLISLKRGIIQVNDILGLRKRGEQFRS